MTFCTAITCMDGRVQMPVNQFLQSRFSVKWVDTITEPGPNGILAEDILSETFKSILHRLNISIDGHGSVGVAIIGHHDCAGNPSGETRQKEQIQQSIKNLKAHVAIEIIGLWVDSNWIVHEL